MKFKLVVFILANCAIFLNGFPIKTEDGDGEYGDYFEGDMILSDEQRNSIFNYKNGKIRKKYRWPDGIVYYEIATIYDAAHVNQIKRAMRKIENVTCIRFRPRNVFTRNYVYINSESGCSSEVGRKGGIQKLSLKKRRIGEKCFKLGTIMHELIHTLGFYHQHSAIDRDNYITIMWDNIKDGKENNFRNYSTIDFGVPYDYESIMHYNATAFSKNDEPTIIPHEKNVKIGQREKMSESDIEKINLMYDCPQD